MQANHSEWMFRHWVGDARDFHALDLASERAVWWCEVASPAIVLGSTQQGTDVAPGVAEQMNLDIVTRRSGGGAVFVHPTDALWIDVTISRDDELWTDDVSTSMLWLGDVFVRALSPWIDAETYRGVFRPGTDGRAVCFDSLAPGEVVSDGRKLVGISQRRGRFGARLQCVLYRHWNPEQWAPVFVSHDLRDRVMKMDVATVNCPLQEIAHAVCAAMPLAN
jgi:lipoate-protein ligase A